MGRCFDSASAGLVVLDARRAHVPATLGVDRGTVTADGGVPRSDGGRTDGSAGDGSVASDTGASLPPADGGCGCRTATGARDEALLLPFALALLAARRLRA